MREHRGHSSTTTSNSIGNSTPLEPGNQNELRMRSRLYLAGEIELDYTRVRAFSLLEGNEWIIPKVSLKDMRKMGCSNELIGHIAIEATKRSKKYWKTIKYVHNSNAASCLLYPIIFISIPLAVSSLSSQASLPELFEQFQSSMNNFFNNDPLIAGFRDATGIKMHVALDSEFEFGETKSPNCSIYFDVPKHLLLQAQNNRASSASIPINQSQLLYAVTIPEPVSEAVRDTIPVANIAL